MKKTLLLVAALFSLNACSLLPEPYKVPVTQGNIIKQEQVEQLARGMTERQVIYVLGTPMVRDTFTPDEWHYLFKSKYATSADKTSPINQLTLKFKDGALIDIVQD
ncbi:outer membrane protein assembly factor BamE [Marinomonas balearica]|uniref:Outer membrane protein assembly factor BamE n=1 Tax=Marinomonas balearica TaxID=491947 RepID=A0A4R6M403_9GAMM|nr:outer membrane protein assembly factor BamE [Marinomonas balearica]TDO95924.1 Beta-barrel assembly machine subunit BamE [Marinomonas balearica]